MTNEQQRMIERIANCYASTKIMLAPGTHAHSDDGTGKCAFCPAVKGAR